MGSEIAVIAIVAVFSVGVGFFLRREGQKLDADDRQ
ncbi:hypothetical protein PARPLA_03154 [Rhodobacteraceae bacterium THAF1]|nr:hypothetical protein FIU81_07725 [Palleronia sp. THAF1]VDC30611.1 hypothetical protein PARPLA_03154 [Rhodobacteraceae bacterium THAF1]